MGILVAEIRVTWSLDWAIWFAAGVRQNAWNRAAITQITPNCDWDTGFFGGVKQGKRRGSYIHFKPTSVINMPLTAEFLGSKPVQKWLKKKQKEDSSGGTDATSPRSAWKFHVHGADTASPWIILHNAGASHGLPTIGVLDISASEQALAGLESAPVGEGDRPRQPLAVERIVFEGSGGGGTPVRRHISAGTCMHLAAVIAAVDGKLSPNELQEVVATMARIGVPEQQARDRFITVCKRVSQEGIEEWTNKLCSMLVSPDQAGMGLSAADLSTLLHTLATAGGGDTPEKQRILSRFVAALRG